MNLAADMRPRAAIPFQARGSSLASPDAMRIIVERPTGWSRGPGLEPEAER